jgi:hypothetical protein
MMRILLLVMMAYATVGLIVSLTVHILSFFGAQSGSETLFVALHVGIFPLWIPVVLIAQKAVGPARRKDSWKIMLSGCPTWMKYMTYGFFYYAIANFIFFIATAVFIAPVAKQTSGAPPPTVWHGFSGHWMAFYAAGLAVSTSAYRRGFDNLTPRCPNGHVVGFDDAFCPTCGVRLAPSNQSAA